MVASRWRRVLLTVVVALVLVAGALSPATAVKATRVVTLDVTPPATQAQPYRDLVGQVEYSPPGDTVFLERYLGAGRWAAVTHQTSSGAASRFRFRIPTPPVGQTTFRARVGATRTAAAATSYYLPVQVFRECTLTVESRYFDVTVGTPVTVRGTFLPAPVGSRVQLWRRNSSQWHVVRADAPVAPDGSFTLTYSPTADEGTVTYDIVLRPPDQYTYVTSYGGPVYIDATEVRPPGGLQTASLTQGPGAVVDHGTIYSHVVSGDGSVVAYSGDDSLLPGDTNHRRDIVALERSTGARSLVTRGFDGSPANGSSGTPQLSSDGRYVAFSSSATNLVPDDTNRVADVFVADRATGTIERLVSSEGGSQPAAESRSPSISADGRYVSYSTMASNLDPEDTQHWAVVVTDRRTAATRTVHVERDGSPSEHEPVVSKISPDGSVVSFASAASDLVPGDSETGIDIFVADRVSGSLDRVRASLDQLGAYVPGSRAWSLSDNGRFVAFETHDNTIAPDDSGGAEDIVVTDRETGKSVLASPGTAGFGPAGDSVNPRISADGRYVTYQSDGPDNVPSGLDPGHDSDIFVRDLAERRTYALSLAGYGAFGDADSYLPSVSANGRTVVYLSWATNLTREDRQGPELYAGTW